MLNELNDHRQQEQLHTELVTRTKNEVEDVNHYHYPYAEFGIPKGRIDKKDHNNLECAIREFEEETGYKANHLNFRNTPPTSLTEDFIGTNGVKYTHIYYIAEIDPSIPIPVMTPRQLGEIQNVGWFTEKEIISVLRPYDTAKKEVIEKAFKHQCDSESSKTLLVLTKPSSCSP